jgi:hypothetical protein
MQKLNQVVALEHSTKSRTHSTISNLHKVSQKSDLFNGFAKSYTPKDEEGDTFPNENKKVQFIATDKLDEFSKCLVELLDITATKDFANCTAVANIVVEGKVIAEKVPVPYLLFLEKQILDIRTYVEALPTLDMNEDWTKDDNSGLFKTNATLTNRTKKIQTALVLYHATDRHPAQTQLITEDVIVGSWSAVKHSGALQLPVKNKYLSKIEKLSSAIKFAREEANSSEAPEVKIGKSIFEYLLS